MNKGNVRGVLVNLVVQCTIMTGLATLLISGGIDLSSGAQAGMASLIFAQILKANEKFLQTQASPAQMALVLAGAIAAALAFGVLAGFINIFFINVLNLMPFIATIGMSSVYGGVASALTRGNAVPIGLTKFTDLGKAAFFERIPLLFIIAVAILAVYEFILLKTSFGRSILMVGGNGYAARLSGLDPKKIRAKLYINNSVIAAVAGLMWTALKKQSNPAALTSAMPDMNALTAAILGGVGFMGGSGELGGAFIGMLMLNIFDNGLTVLKVAAYWNIVAQGFLLIVALILDYFSEASRRKRLSA
jgi:ribose transport system permease protein